MKAHYSTLNTLLDTLIAAVAGIVIIATVWVYRPISRYATCTYLPVRTNVMNTAMKFMKALLLFLHFHSFYNVDEFFFTKV
jgi:hypothetical protein